ncbi:MAG: type III-A CRISPR-associated protein Cas10/Csm1 [Chloroherpetonaceae bacterium]|nr:type III-A CRISPR-associated protein Cas10/Csm1 [Chloroherpetonaceae bacterium]
MNLNELIKKANEIFENKAQLKPLKNPFGGETSFEPVQLDFKTINFPKPIPTKSQLPNDQINTLQDVEQYGSFIASEKRPTVSLYDALKTEAAINDCKEEGEKNNPFLLVSADFSGIQDTVYTISSKGALKTLRARSFMLELLTEHIIYELVGDNRYQIIYSGGGGFSLLMPNMQSHRDTVNNFREVLNKWAKQEFSGKFFIALDAHPFSDISKFAEARKAQSENLDKQKRRKFLNQLGGFFTPQMPKQTTVQTECQITRRDDLPPTEMFALPDDVVKPSEKISMQDVLNKKEKRKSLEDYTWASESCYHQFHIGDNLITAKYIYRSDVTPDSNKNYFEFPKKDSSSAYYYIDGKSTQSPRWKINGFEEGCYPLFYANYVRKHGDLSENAKSTELKAIHDDVRKIEQSDEIEYDTATFEGLAASSCGAELIGALRMDVDNLGKNFQDIETPQELSQKSRLLNLFFKGYLNQICNGTFNGVEQTNILGKDYSNGRNVSVIYAGGDDLFIIGAWDETAELAFDIQKCFHRFTGGDANQISNRLGISGGLTLHHPKFPLYQMAKKSGEAEGVAKNDKDKGESNPHKNRIGLFFDDNKAQRQNRLLKKERYMLSMKWQLANQFLLQLMKVYAKCGETKNANGRIVFEVNKFSYSTIEKWFAIIEKHQETGKMHLPTMARVLKQVETQISKYSETHPKLFTDLTTYIYANDPAKQNWMSHFHIALNWLSYLRRTK